jgi:hypothetical protein
MKNLREYITEAQQWIDSPAAGDDFAINIREECLLESHVVEVLEDAIVIEADDQMIAMLEQYGLLDEEPVDEEIRRYGAVGSSPGQGYTMAEGDIDPNRHPQTRDYGRGDDADKVKRAPQTRLDNPWDAISDEPDSVGRDSRMKDPRKYDDPWQYVQDSEQDFRRVMELAGVQVKGTEANITDPLADKAAALAPVGADGAQEPVATVDETQDPDQHLSMSEGVMSDVDMDLRHIAKTQRMDALVGAMRGEFGIETQQYLQDMMDQVENKLDRRGMRSVDMETKLGMLMDRIQEIYAGQDISEAEYQGRKVALGKPMQGDVAKFKVYVKDPKTGNVKKVNFGDKTMRIKKSNPARRKSFRARHNCANPGPRTKARYWSCRKW